MPTKANLKVTLEKTKVTKGAVMFALPEGETGPITNLYIRKDGGGELVNAEKITVTVEAT